MKIKSILILTLILFSLIPVVMVKATTETYQISDDSDDVFMSGTGGVFVDTPLIIIKDPEIDLLAFLRFQNITIYKNSRINEAILSVQTNNLYEEDPDNLVTIYGLDEDDCQPFGNTADLNTRIETTESVIWNVSSVHTAGVWHNVTVTEIVKEIVKRYGWDYGNSLGFEILGASGDDTRTFRAYYYQPDSAPKIYITFEEIPEEEDPGYPHDLLEDHPDAIYNQSYDGYDIWRTYDYENLAEDWTLENPFGLISLPNDYLAYFQNYGYEHFWNGHHEFERKIGVNNGNTNFEARFYCDLINVDTSYHRPDFYWMRVYSVENHFIQIQHDVEPLATSPTHYVTLQGYSTESGIYYVEGEAWWLSIRINATHVQFRAYDGGEYPEWDYPTHVYTKSFASFYPAAADDEWGSKIEFLWTMSGLNWYDGETDGDAGYMTLLVDGEFVNQQHFWVINASDGETLHGCETNLNDTIEWIDHNLPSDPHNPIPDPWEDSPISRFTLRLYFLVMGLTALIGPFLFFCYRRPSASVVIIGLVIMLFGLGFLIQVGQI